MVVKMSITKVSVHMPDELNNLVEDLCEKNHITKSEFIRKALALMTYSLNYKQKGGHLAILDKNDKKLADVVGL
jgi:Arc/MetJ-type ribon-helix-helix transcriptional regulator